MNIEAEVKGISQDLVEEVALNADVSRAVARRVLESLIGQPCPICNGGES